METNADEQSKKKSALYGGLTYLSLVLLALTWSIHSSFVFFFLGFAAFFLYLTIQNLRFNSTIFQRPDPPEHQILKDLKKTFKDQGIAVPKDTPSYSPSATQKKMTLIITGVVAFVMVMIFIGLFSESSEFTAEYYFQQGENSYYRSEFDSARLYYRRAFTAEPEYKEAMVGYGNALMAKDQYDSAIIMYDKVLLMDDEFEPALYQKSMALSYQGRNDESIVQAKKLLEISPTYYDAMQLVGDGFYNQKQYDSAMVWYEDAYANEVRNRYLCHLLGYLHQTKGNTQKAIALYKEALYYDSMVVDIYERLEGIVPAEEKTWYRQKITALQPSQ